MKKRDLERKTEQLMNLIFDSLDNYDETWETFYNGKRVCIRNPNKKVSLDILWEKHAVFADRDVKKVGILTGPKLVRVYTNTESRFNDDQVPTVELTDSDAFFFGRKIHNKLAKRIAEKALEDQSKGIDDALMALSGYDDL